MIVPIVDRIPGVQRPCADRWDPLCVCVYVCQCICVSDHASEAFVHQQAQAAPFPFACPFVASFHAGDHER